MIPKAILLGVQLLDIPKTVNFALAKPLASNVKLKADNDGR